MTVYPMLYALNELGYAAATPWRAAARVARDFWSSPANPAVDTPFARNMFAAADLFSNVTRRYGKPDWRIDAVQVNGQTVRVREEVEWSSPGCACCTSRAMGRTCAAPAAASGARPC